MSRQPPHVDTYAVYAMPPCHEPPFREPLTDAVTRMSHGCRRRRRLDAEMPSSLLLVACWLMPLYAF